MKKDLLSVTDMENTTVALKAKHGIWESCVSSHRKTLGSTAEPAQLRVYIAEHVQFPDSRTMVDAFCASLDHSHQVQTEILPSIPSFFFSRSFSYNKGNEHFEGVLV